MRLSRLTLLLTACALTALATPSSAQDGSSGALPQAGNSPASPDAPAVVIESEAVAPASPAPVVPIPAEWSPVPADEMGQSAYGLYLSGRLAA